MGREDVLVHQLGAADRLRDGDQEVIGLLVDAREGLQEHSPVWTHPQRPAKRQT